MKTKKLIPELRFPEFINEYSWREKKLESIAEITMGASPSSLSYNNDNVGLPLLQGNADINNRLSAPRVYTSEITKECEINDILLSVRAPVGTVAKSLHKACIGRGISALRTINRNSQEYLYQWLLSYESSWGRISQGGTFEAVNSVDLRNIDIPVPDLQEQQKIASCLSSLDEVITAESQKLDALKEHKKGLMQNLFPQEGEKVPKYRFPEFVNDEEWEERKLEKIAIRITDKNESGSIKKVFTNSAADGIIDQRDFFDKDIANKSNLEGYYIVEPGDYVYNPRISNLAPIGPLAKNKTGNIGIMSPLYTVFRFKDKNNDFYEHYFKTTHWIENVRRIANMGARFDRMSITSLQLMSINVFFPKLNEQQKIASCLSSLDELVKAQSDRIKQLNLHKKGLMQGLFPKTSLL